MSQMLGRGVAAESTSLTAAQTETILGTKTTLDGTLPAIYASPVFHRNANGKKLERLTVTNRKAGMTLPYYSWKCVVGGEIPGGSTVTSSFREISWFHGKLWPSLQSKMKDAQGFWRGRCSKTGCPCSYFMSEDAACSDCDYCEHSPSEHVVLGACTSCSQNECAAYEEDEGDEGSCSYCGCTPADHGRHNCVASLHIVYCALTNLCSIPAQSCTANCQGAINHDGWRDNASTTFVDVLMPGKI